MAVDFEQCEDFSVLFGWRSSHYKSPPLAVNWARNAVLWSHPWLLCISLSLVVLPANAVEPQLDGRDEQTGVPVELQSPAGFSRSRSNRETSRSPKVLRYVQHLMSKYDRDRDGKLQKEEWQAMHGRPEMIDLDGDEVISREELTTWIVDYGQRKQIGVASGLEAEVPLESQTEPAVDDGAATPSERTPRERRRDQKFYVPANRLPAGLPDWFVARDQDGDGQLTVGEFSKSGRAAELAEFATYDTNGDGVMTAKECVGKSTEKTATTAKASLGPPATSLEENPVAKPVRNRRKPQSAK